MAQVISVVLEIGTEDVGDGQIRLPGQPASTSGYREVTVRATFRFSPDEIGTSYRVYAYLYASDRQGEDPDNPNAVAPLWLTEDEGREQIAELSSTNRWWSFSRNYLVHTVTAAGDIAFPPIKRRVKYTLLNEDPGLISEPGGPLVPPRLVFEKDELFARVVLSSAKDSVISSQLV